METMTISGKLVVTTCWCGMAYAIPQALYDFVDRQHRNGEKQTDIYCPLGHHWCFAGEGEADKLRKQLDRTQRTLASREEDVRAIRATNITLQGQLTKARKRAERGVCLHCNRSYVNVQRHVETCHPEVLAES